MGLRIACPQATSAMRASAAIEQEMQAQKLADELKECTFQPRLVSRRCIPRAALSMTTCPLCA
eukprot:2271902-Amphidinium_carterae.3